jgi:hypothetical protein
VGQGEKKSYKRREKRRSDISRESVSDTATTAAHYRSPNAFFIVLHQFAIMGKYSFLFPVVNKF